MRGLKYDGGHSSASPSHAMRLSLSEVCSRGALFDRSSGASSVSLGNRLYRIGIVGESAISPWVADIGFNFVMLTLLPRPTATVFTWTCCFVAANRTISSKDADRFPKDSTGVADVVVSTVLGDMAVVVTLLYG